MSSQEGLIMPPYSDRKNNNSSEKKSPKASEKSGKIMNIQVGTAQVPNRKNATPSVTNIAYR